MKSLRNLFTNEAVDILKRLDDYLVLYKNKPADRELLQGMSILLDNLCEPALMVGMQSVYKIASLMRTTCLQHMAEAGNFSGQLFESLRGWLVILKEILAAETKKLPGKSAVKTETALGLKTPQHQAKSAQENLALSNYSLFIHDLKSPIAIIRSTMELLSRKQKYSHDSELQNAAQRIIRQTDKAIDLIDHVLSQPTGLQAESLIRRKIVKVADLIDDCIINMKIMAEQRKISVVAHVDPSLEILADYERLLEVLDNLLGNAIKYSLEKGSISIKAVQDDRYAPASDMHSVVFQVSDNGIGISEEKLPYIFSERFQVSDDDHKTGHGLGLAICKKICELHGGSIWVKSKLGSGTTFFCVIPWKKSKA